MLTDRFKDVDPLPDDGDLVAALKAVAPGLSGEDGKYMVGIRNIDAEVYRVVTTSVSAELTGITQCLTMRGFNQEPATGQYLAMGLQYVFDRPPVTKVPNFSPKHHGRRRRW